MKLTTRKFNIQVNNVARCLMPVAALMLCASVAVAQDATPSYAPGSIPQDPSLLDVPLSTWEPPKTDAQPAADWNPPVTEADPNLKSAIESVDPASEAVEKAADPVVPAEPTESVFDAPMDEADPLKRFEDEIPVSAQDPVQIPEATPDAIEVPVIPDTPEVTAPTQEVEMEAVGNEAAEEPTNLPGYDNESTIISDFNNAGGACDTSSCGPSRPGLSGKLSSLSAMVKKDNTPVIHTPVRNILRGVSGKLAGDQSDHAVGQLTFLSFARDYRGKGRLLSSGGPNLLANGPDEGHFTGVDLSYSRRRAGGKGYELRYLGFNPDSATDISAGGPQLVWGGLTPPLNDPATWGGTIPSGIPETYGLSGIGLGGFSMADVFDDALNHRVSRDSEFGSFEVNFLRASSGGTRLSCGNAMVELFGGIRGLAFNETTVFTAAATQSAALPRSAFYSSEVKNSLFGLQIGGRMERQFNSKGWSYNFGTRVGIYNNRVESRQRAEFQFDDGSSSTAQLLFGDSVGREFDFTDTDNELAFLGELDFGIVYQFRAQTRARFGYRGIAVTNIADAAGQFEDSLFDVDVVSEPKAFGDLIVGGLYFGVDHAF